MSTIAQLEVDELTTPTYQATLRESATGAVVPGSAITSITVWLFDLATGTIINDRDAFSLSPTLVDENGVLSWTMEEEDHAVFETPEMSGVEIHQAEFEVRWDTPEKVMRHRVQFAVIFYQKVPVAP